MPNIPWKRRFVWWPRLVPLVYDPDGPLIPNWDGAPKLGFAWLCFVERRTVQGIVEYRLRGQYETGCEWLERQW